MFLNTKENELECFKLAKLYFNSNPKEYEKSLKELNKISILIKNITIIHMKTLCLLMLSKYEDIIEFYYIHRIYLDSIFNQNKTNKDNESEENEIKKIISIAFYNLGMRQKAKSICPDIKDDYQSEKFQIEIISEKKENNIKVNSEEKEKLNIINPLKSNRINENIVLKNIKHNLDDNLKNKKKEEEKNETKKDTNLNLNTSKDLMPISTQFVDDLFKSAIKTNKLKNLQQIFENDENAEKDETPRNNNEKDNLKEQNEKLKNKDNSDKNNELDEEEKGGFIEKNDTMSSKLSKGSNISNIYNKLKEGISNIDDLTKEDGLLMTFEEKIKEMKNDKEEKSNDDKNKENENKHENNDNKNDDNEKQENIKSNRSEKTKKKEIKGPLKKQKIPFVKKLTNVNVSTNFKLKKKIVSGDIVKSVKENENEIEEEKEIINKEEEEENEDKENKNSISSIENKEKEEDKENKESQESKEKKENLEKDDDKDNKEATKNEPENKNKEEKIENNNKALNNHNNNNVLKKSFTQDKERTFINKEIKRIYLKPNNNEKNNTIRKESLKENNKRISEGFIKNCKTYGYKNPFEFTLNPEEGGSFKAILSNLSQNEKKEEEENKNNVKENIKINDKKEENKKDLKSEEGSIINIDKNRALLRVEIDGEQIDLVQNDNPSRKNSKYADYINIDYKEFSNKKRKVMIDKFRESAVKSFDIKNKGQMPKSTKINSFNLRGVKNTTPFSINESDNSSFSKLNETNLKKTCFYKTNYFLNKFDN